MRRWLAALAAVATGGGIPAAGQEAPELEFVFEETVTLGPEVQVGDTARGRRIIIPITGGTFAGPGNGEGFTGDVMPGGWDWQLVRADGCLEVKADYFLKTNDGAVINVVNTGTICPGEGGAMQPVRTHPVFEPPLGKYQWLGQSAFVGTLELGPPEQGPAVKIRFFRLR